MPDICIFFQRTTNDSKPSLFSMYEEIIWKLYSIFNTEYIYHVSPLLIQDLFSDDPKMNCNFNYSKTKGTLLLKPNMYILWCTLPQGHSNFQTAASHFLNFLFSYITDQGFFYRITMHLAFTRHKSTTWWYYLLNSLSVLKFAGLQTTADLAPINSHESMLISALSHLL